MNLGALLRKEILEQVRTHRLLILAAVFVFVGVSSPIMLEILPDIIKGAANFPLTLPEFTRLDVLDSYVKGLVQMGLPVVAFVSAAAVAAERERGTASLLLSRPVSRGSFLAAKASALLVVVFASLAAGAVGCLYYTAILFEPLRAVSFFWWNAGFAAVAALVVAFGVFWGVIVRSQLGAGGATFGSYLALMLLPMLHPWLARNSPAAVGGLARGMETGAASPGELGAPALFAVGVAVVLLAAAWAVFRRQDI